MPKYDVNVSRVCYFSRTYQIDADTPDQAESVGLKEAKDDNAEHWQRCWDDVEVDGVIERPEKK